MQSSPSSPTLQRQLWISKIQSFLVVALALFLLLSVAWTFRVSGYVSRGVVAVDVVKTPQAVAAFKRTLGDIVARHTSPDSVNEVLTESRATFPSSTLTKLSQQPNFAAQFKAYLKKSPEEGRFELMVSYSGRGTKSESYMVNLMTTNIAREFLASPWSAMGTGAIKVPASLPASGIAEQSNALQARAIGMIDQIESSHRSGTQLSGENAPNSSSLFSNAGYTKEQSSGGFHPPTVELRETVGQLSSLVHQASVSGGAGANVAFSVRGVSGRPPTPIGGVPSSPVLLVFFLVSTVVAGTVAIAFRPFEKKGFESVDRITSKLGVPVLATIRTSMKSPTVDDSENSDGGSWANKAVHSAELALFAITVIVLGFCVINQTIRAAFAENIYHGFTRIWWMFNS